MRALQTKTTTQARKMTTRHRESVFASACHGGTCVGQWLSPRLRLPHMRPHAQTVALCASRQSGPRAAAL